MTFPDQFMEKARELRNGVLWTSNSSIQIIAAALSTSHREGFEEAAAELISAWNELPDGDHDIETANAWFANSLFPVLERFKARLSEAERTA